MKERQAVQIPKEFLDKLEEIEEYRPDIRGYNTSRKVFVAMQEWLKEQYKKKIEKPIRIIEEEAPSEN